MIIFAFFSSPDSNISDPYSSDTGPDPNPAFWTETIRILSGSRVLMTKNCKNVQQKLQFIYP
jgi:hypothetical protein